MKGSDVVLGVGTMGVLERPLLDVAFSFPLNTAVLGQINIQFTAYTFCKNDTKFPKGPILGSDSTIFGELEGVILGTRRVFYNLVFSLCADLMDK